MSIEHDPRIGTQEQDESYQELQQYPELYRSVAQLCEAMRATKPEMSIDELAIFLKEHPEALGPVRSLLSPGSQLWQRDMESADAVRERLAWRLVDTLLDLE